MHTTSVTPYHSELKIGSNTSEAISLGLMSLYLQFHLLLARTAQNIVQITKLKWKKASIASFVVDKLTKHRLKRVNAINRPILSSKNMVWKYRFLRPRTRLGMFHRNRNPMHNTESGRSFLHLKSAIFAWISVIWREHFPPLFLDRQPIHASTRLEL